MVFGLWVQVTLALAVAPVIASRTEERSFRHALSSKDLEPPHLSETAAVNTTNMAVGKVDTNSTVGLSAAAKEALHRLLHDIASLKVGPEIEFGVKKGPGESKEEFMPKCLAHVEDLVHTVDKHYTDAQLESVLQQECQLSKEFPNTHSSNFHTHEACMEFATKLSDARMKELETGETKQYEEFCADYYQHAATGAVATKTTVKKTQESPEKVEAAKPKDSTHSGAKVAGFAIGAICAVFL